MRMKANLLRMEEEKDTGYLMNNYQTAYHILLTPICTSFHI